MFIESPKIKKNILSQIEEIVGPEGYSYKPLDRFNYSRDSNFKSVIQIKYNQAPYLPDVIAWPKTAAEVQKLVKMAGEHRIPVVPFGAGSGVCGGTVPVKGGLVIDLKKLRKLLLVDEENLLATTEAGIMGLHLEEELQRKGYTLGHFPSSILCASLGGYLAARSAGQESSRYGKIEDMVLNLEMIDGRGEVIQTRNVANVSGINLNDVFVGSEGTLGLITKATLRIYPLPPSRAWRAFRFKNMASGFEAIRRLMQMGQRPAVVRLYDELDSLIFLSNKKQKSFLGLAESFKSLSHVLKYQSLKVALNFPQSIQMLIKTLSSGCLLVMRHEGHERIVAEEQKQTRHLFLELDAQDLGVEPAKLWEAKRYHVSYAASPLFYEGFFTDTIEVAATWDRLQPLYKAMLGAMVPHCLVMAHLSHVYRDGGSLYFTFVALFRGAKKSEGLYDLIWDHALKACQKQGGVISHHHGIGRLKAKYMDEEWGMGQKIFTGFKKLYDPKGIMNPGKLFLMEKEMKRQVA